MRIALLALEELFDTGLTVTLDAFTIANRISAREMGRTPFFEVSIVGVRKRVRSGQGLAILVRAVTPNLKNDDKGWRPSAEAVPQNGRLIGRSQRIKESDFAARLHTG